MIRTIRSLWYRVLFATTLFMSDFTNTVATIAPGMGSPSQRLTSLDNNFAAGTNTMTLTPSPGMRKGWIRIRTKGSAAVPPTQSATGVTTTSLVVTASDGTRTYVLEALLGGIGTANQNFDKLIPFNLDIVATTFVATLVTAVGAVFADMELVGGN